MVSARSRISAVFSIVFTALAVPISGIEAHAQTANAATLELTTDVSLTVSDLRRMPDKGIMQLTFAVTNTSNSNVRLSDLGLADGFKLEPIGLVDFATKHQYDMGSAEGSCLCSKTSDSGLVTAGQTRKFWAWYALPPASVQKMTVNFKGQMPIMDVPVQ